VTAPQRSRSLAENNLVSASYNKTVNAAPARAKPGFLVEMEIPFPGGFVPWFVSD